MSLAAAASLAACTGDAEPKDLAVATTSTVADTTTSATEVVSLDTEVRQAAIDLLEIRNEVLMNPDVSRVSEYISETCVCLERERGGVERFVREGLRWTAPAVTVRGIRIAPGDTDQVEPTLTVVAVQPDAAIVRADGTVDEVVPYSDEAAYLVALLRDAGGAWRINGLEGISLNDETIAEVLAVGVP
jgi:hypothetical protein